LSNNHVATILDSATRDLFKMSNTCVLIGILLLWYAASASCIDVPKEWREAIRELCCDAEKGIFPHPSPKAQMLQGRIHSDVQPQVRSYLSVTLL